VWVSGCVKFVSGVEPREAASMRDAFWRVAFRLGFPVAKAWWRLRRARREGAAVAIWVGRDLLAVRSSYRRQWSFPGGSLKRGETPEAAARRELLEEIGLAVTSLVPAGEVSGLWDGLRNRVHVFELRIDEPPKLKLDNREIVAARLMPPEEFGGLAVTGWVAAYLKRTAGALRPSPAAFDAGLGPKAPENGREAHGIGAR
jgi:8-oxo-dGTP diphosphatase